MQGIFKIMQKAEESTGVIDGGQFSERDAEIDVAIYAFIAPCIGAK